tara:strand:- start:60 stop:272 length:213 start_codon:yes stop_codon:yes gene_type:complete
MIGTKVIGVWGAMIPEEHGVIVDMVDDCVEIEFSSGDDTSWIMGIERTKLRTDYMKRYEGSPIGVYYKVA